MKLESVEYHRILKDGVELGAEDILLSITLVRENMLRLRSTIGENFRQEETFVVHRQSFSPPPVQIEKREGALALHGGELSLTVHLDPSWIEAGNSSVGLFLSTPAGQSLEWSGKKGTQRFDLPAGTGVYGLGQGTESVLDLRDRERRMWQQWDGFRYNGNGGIPFMISAQGYGMLLNSSWASRFAIGRARTGTSSALAKPEGPWKADQPSGEHHPGRIAVIVEGGDLDLFWWRR